MVSYSHQLVVTCILRDMFFAEYPNAASSRVSKAAMGGILASTIVVVFALSTVATILIMRRRSRHRSRTVSRRSCKSLYTFCKQ
jgi:hypothetical protein